jgi:hypothetical protein
MSLKTKGKNHRPIENFAKLEGRNFRPRARACSHLQTPHSAA